MNPAANIPFTDEYHEPDPNEGIIGPIDEVVVEKQQIEEVTPTQVNTKDEKQ